MIDIDIKEMKSNLKLLAGRLARCNGNVSEIDNECKLFIELAKKMKYKEISNLEDIINEAEYVMKEKYSDRTFTSDQISKILEMEIINKYTDMYDKSKKIDSGMLATIVTSKGQEFKAVKYMPKEEPVTIYEDEGISIQAIGTLNFKHPTGLADYITKYRVKRENGMAEVYSSIIAPDMQEDELYRQAVLDVLLSENNIKLSNCDGYIGTIEEIDHTDKEDYVINSKYCLNSEITEATAVHEYARMMKEIKKSKEMPKSKSNKELRKEHFMKILNDPDLER